VEAWATGQGRLKSSQGPVRDPFYRAILQGLASELDPRLFEACVADLLHPEIPVSPVRGGDDLGMDGAVFDGQGVSYPLITTAGEDAIGNLTRNLTRYLETDGSRRLAVFATSGELSALRRRNLERRAESLGFTLVQIIDGRGMADRLYRNPRWCKELLGVTGEAPALSVIPVSARPLRQVQLVGRDEETRLIRSSEGDQLVVGPPGSGKTALLAGLARDGRGLFITEADRGRIADGIRQQAPASIIVDDAHVQLGALETLIQVRAELGAEFRIIATCWPGERHLIAKRIGISDSESIEIGRLTRDEVVEVVREAGVRGPTQLVREIVDQADGLPGLAVTLAMICLRAGVRDVVLGNAISADIRSTLEPRLGPRATQILATLGLGGDGGLSLVQVARGLDLSIADVRSIAVGLAAAGVLQESPTGNLVVRPSALRHALVRDVFFGDLPRMPVQPLLAHVSLQQAAVILVEVAAIGGRVPWDLLIRALRDAGSDLAWAMWARAGVGEATQVLRENPQVVLSQPWPFLHWLPQEALRLLLDAAVDDRRELGPNPDHPLRLIADWIGGAVPGKGEALVRRRALIRAVVQWASSSESSDLPGRAMALALQPGFESHSTDPGMGMTVTLTWGLLPLAEIEGIATLWSDEIQPFLKTQPAAVLSPVVDAIRDWVHPSFAARSEPPQEVAEVMSGFASRMLTDLQEVAAGHVALQLKIRNLASAVGLSVDSVASDYSLLYGEIDVSDWQQATETRLIDIETLAEVRKNVVPSEVARELAAYEEMSREAGHTWPRFTPQFSEMLAARAIDPVEWCEALVQEQIAADILHPFLNRAFEINEDAAWRVLSGVIDRREYEWLAVWIGLSRPDTPEEFVDLALERAQGFAKNLEWVAQRRQLSGSSLSRLLAHPEDEVASAVAIGMWLREEAPPSDAHLTSLWRQAILRSPDEGGEGGYWLGQILATDSQLAHDWLRRRLRSSSPPSLIGPNPVGDAVSVLDDRSRVCLVRVLPVSWASSSVARLLVGDQEDIYLALLVEDRLKPLHLAPLSRRPDDSWLVLASTALRSGYTASEVAEAAYMGMHSWMGDESAMWESWLESFAAISAGGDDQLEAVVRRGVELASARRDQALAREREWMVHGRD
jgi:predicted ATPase